MLVNVTCKNCGRENQDLYRFCAGCGDELDASDGGHGDKSSPARRVADSGDVGDLADAGNGAVHHDGNEAHAHGGDRRRRRSRRRRSRR